MSLELEDIILTIDTREQNRKRIKAVEDWFTGHGTIVEHSALKHCDYRLIGEFRGQSVNLGVEAKGWDNFLSDDIAEMEEKLLKATGEYDHVGFFVETQNYSFVPDENNKHGKLNYSIPRLNKNLPAKTLAAFEGFLDTISKHPQIHVRQLRSEAQFPYSLYDLLVYLQKPHTLTVKPQGYVPSLQNLYMQIPQVGIERAKKLIQHYPNLFWLCSASEESLIAVMGMSSGTIIYQYLHNTELQTPEWMAGHHLDGTEKDGPEKLICSACGLDKCTCVPYLDNPLLKKDDEGRQAFDAPAKNPKKCSFADPKKHAECKTPDHFKQLSKPIDDDSIAIMAAIEGYLSGFPKGKTVNEICTHFNMHSGDPDKEKLIKYIKQLAWDEKITSQGNIFKHSSHAEKSILSNHNIPPFSADTPSHPVISHTTIIHKPDDPHISPPINSAVKQEGLLVISPSAEINIGLNDKQLECVVKCRACYQVIDPSNDDDTGFCHDPECIAERKKPVHAKNLIDSLKLYLKKPHTVPEIVQEFGCGNGYAFDSCMGGVKAGWLKKVTEQNGRTTFQRIRR